MPEIVDGKDWAQRVVDNTRKTRILSDPNVRAMDTSNQIRVAAAPYEVFVHEDMSTYDVKISLVDNRQESEEKITVRIPQGAMTDNRANTIMRAVEAAKKRLQHRLAANCDEPEIRLWAAENRDVDLMDNSEIPSRIRAAYVKEKGTLRRARQDLSRTGQVATEQSIESDNDPIVETPRPRTRKIKRRPRVVGADPFGTESVVGESTEEEEKTSVPVVKTVKGAHSKAPVRKPRCKNRDHDEPVVMEFDPEIGLWKCPEPGCGMTARTKSETPVGQIVLGKGRIDFRVVFTEDSQQPSIILLADNNIALDITQYVDMENFMKYSHARAKAQSAAAAGEQITIGTASSGARSITALLKFPEMRIYGCDNA